MSKLHNQPCSFLGRLTWLSLDFSFFVSLFLVFSYFFFRPILICSSIFCAWNFSSWKIIWFISTWTHWHCNKSFSLLDVLCLLGRHLPPLVVMQYLLKWNKTLSPALVPVVDCLNILFWLPPSVPFFHTSPRPIVPIQQVVVIPSISPLNIRNVNT